MSSEVITTREIPPPPARADDAHKGDVGRIVVIGGSFGEVTMIGAPALAANAALRSGAGLVQLFVPEEIRAAAATLSPCSTIRTLPTTGKSLLAAIESYQTDVVVLGPGLGTSLAEDVFTNFLTHFAGPMVIDADGLNLLASFVGSMTRPTGTRPCLVIPNTGRIVMTPHPGEARRLLEACGESLEIFSNQASRKTAARALVAHYRCVAVLKGAKTIVTGGHRLYTNETGNSGLASAGTGDVLSGVIAALIGQKMEPLEAAILGVYLHGLAGDFAAEELGRRSMTALDVIDFLPEAFTEHELAQSE